MHWGSDCNTEWQRFLDKMLPLFVFDGGENKQKTNKQMWIYINLCRFWLAYLQNKGLLLVCISGENLPLLQAGSWAFILNSAPCPCIRVTERVPILMKKYKPLYFINNNLHTLSEYKHIIHSRMPATVNKSLKLHSGSLWHQQIPSSELHPFIYREEAIYHLLLTISC